MLGRAEATGPASGIECAGAEKKVRVIVRENDCGRGSGFTICSRFRPEQKCLRGFGAALN